MALVKECVELIENASTEIKNAATLNSVSLDHVIKVVNSLVDDISTCVNKQDSAKRATLKRRISKGRIVKKSNLRSMLAAKNVANLLQASRKHQQVISDLKKSHRKSILAKNKKYNNLHWKLIQAQAALARSKCSHKKEYMERHRIITQQNKAHSSHQSSSSTTDSDDSSSSSDSASSIGSSVQFLGYVKNVLID